MSVRFSVVGFAMFYVLFWLSHLIEVLLQITDKDQDVGWLMGLLDDIAVMNSAGNTD